MTDAGVSLYTPTAATHSPDSSLRYMPGLDVIRGVAILGVLVYHGLGSRAGFFEAFHTRWATALGIVFEAGSKGVHLFFVLSGFLISGILIDRRHYANYYKDFYLRRILRIAPAYLVMLALLFLTHSITLRYLLIAVFYFANMAGLFHGSHEYGPLWSLSVEEQFYLVWPWVVRNTSRRTLIYLCIGIIAAVPPLRFGLLYAPKVFSDIYTKTWAVADFFAAGALLALAIRIQGTLEDRAYAVKRFFWPLVAGFVALSLVLSCFQSDGNSTGHRVVAALELEPWLFLSTAMVLLGWLRPAIASVVLLRPLVFLAYISYGLYLCHQFFFSLVERHWAVPTDGRMSSLGWLCLRFLCESLLAITVATVSRYTLEEFFLRMKPKARPTGPPAPLLT